MQPSWEAADDDAPLTRRRSPLLAILAAVVAISLAAGVISVAFERGGDDTETSTPGIEDPPPGDAAPPATEDALEAEVAAISAFVSEVRGLEFERAVDVELLDDDAFAARVAESAVEDLEELGETEDVLRALGLVPDGIDLAKVLQSFLGDTVVGFYDPELDQLVVRGAALTPYVRATLAHELTHALDDQHFELERPALDEADDESGLGFSALVEGNALRVEDAFVETFTDEEEQARAEEEARLAAGIDLANVPRVLPELIGFPYAVGPALVDALVEQGGEARVNEAFGAPPTTSEQVVDPLPWLAGQLAPVAVDPPAADGEVFDQGVLGLWGLVVLLGDELGQREAFNAAQGWGGDWYVAWRDGDRTCVRNTFVMDSRRDLDELEAGLDDWAASQDDVEVQREGASLTFTACG